MCRMTPLLLLAGLAVGRATPAPSLIGAPLPAGYVVNRNFTPELSSVYRDEGRQISVALRPGNYTFLVMARDARTGRTVWKFHGQGTASVDARLAGQGAVMVTVITTGAITRSQALLLDARTGRVRRKGLFTLEGVRDGKALFMQYDEAPPSAAFLAEPQRAARRSHAGQNGAHPDAQPSHPHTPRLRPSENPEGRLEHAGFPHE